MTDHWEEFVASLDDDDEADSALHYDALEYAGPPVSPLEFPTPTINSAWLMSVRAVDHRNGKNRILDNVLMRAPSGRSNYGGNARGVNNEPTRAFLIRKKITQTTFGSIRVAVVLRRRDEDEPQANVLPWISTEELVAVKISSWQKIRQSRGQSTDDPMREVAALQHVGNYNPHVCGCIEVLQCEDFLYTVMPYFSQGSNLHGRLFADPGVRESSRHPPPNEDEARTIFRQLLKGLFHLQCKGVHHRDISLNNLLISKTNRLKIVDLGMSLRVPYSDPCNEGCVTDVSEGTTRRLLKPQGKGGGQLMYLAPEVLAENQPVDGFAVDLWAAGVILFVLCVGLAPFKYAAPEEKRYAKISSGGLKHLMNHLRLKVSPEACDLIQNMLWENPRHRLSLAEVMKHPWVMGKVNSVRSIHPMVNAVSGDVSIGSEGSTEDAQGDHAPSLIKAASHGLTVAAAVRPEARDSVSELRDSTRPEGVHHKMNQGFKHLQQIGPKLRTNAQQMGPRLVSNAQRIGPRMKNAIANVNIHRGNPNTNPSSDPNNDGAGMEEAPSNISPHRRVLGRFQKKAAVPKTS